MTFSLRVRDRFSAAHSVTLPDGSPEPVHGHNWELEAEVSAPGLDSHGMVADFLEVQKVIREHVTSRLDHSFLNESGLFPGSGPTCENVAAWAAESLAQPLRALRPDLTLVSLTLWETPFCGVTITPNKGENK